MKNKIIGVTLAAAFLLSIPSVADAGPPRFARTTRRAVNNIRRDVRQFDRQRTRTYNQLDRSFRRTAPVYRGIGNRYPYGRTNFGFPSRSGVYFGGNRGGVFIGF